MGSSERRETFPMVQSSKLNLYPPKNIDFCCDFSGFFCRSFFDFGRPFELETFGRSPIISKHIVDVQGPGNHLWYIPSTSFTDKVCSFVFHHPNFFVKSLLSNERIFISHCTKLYSTIFIQTLQILHKIYLLWLFGLILQLHLAETRSFFVPSISLWDSIILGS